jgi:trigger factor
LDLRDEEGSIEADVRITLWPDLGNAPEYSGRRIEVEAPQVSDEDVDEQVDRMRNQFAELDDVEREGFDGDFVLIDVKTSSGDEEVAAGSATDMLYEIGSGAFLDGLDEALGGKGAGHIAKFDTTLPAAMGEEGGTAVTATVLVKQVKTKRLPELTDEWVDDVSEFETIEEMRAELREQMTLMRLGGARAEFEERLLEELRGEIDLQLPADLVDAEADSVLHRFAHRLSERQVNIEQYLQITGQDQESFVSDLRNQAEMNLNTRLLLEAVIRDEGLEVSAEEIDEVVEGLARAADTTPEEYRKVIDEGGHGESLAGDILRRKAIDRLLEVAVAVDADGNTIEFPTPEERDAATDDEAGDAEDDVEPAEVEE